MGFWDVRVAGLTAQGESFTAEEIRALEEGGMVLHLHPLEYPEYEAANWYQREDGEAVLVPELVNCFAPGARSNSAWEVGAGRTAAEAVDDLTYSGRAEWTRYPSYLGVLADHYEEMYWGHARSEEITPYLWFNCWPLTEESSRDIGLIQMAGQKSLNDSGHYELGWYIQMWAEGDYPAEFPWLLVNHSDALSQAERNEIVQTIAESSWNGWSQYELDQVIREQAGMFQYLYQHKIVDADDERFRHGGLPSDPVFTPLEHLLEAEGHFTAADLWRRLQARRRYALANLTGASTRSPYLTPKEFWE